MLSPSSTPPKIHQSVIGDWVILDQKETPFWWARFQCEADALAAWTIWQDTLVTLNDYRQAEREA